MEDQRPATIKHIKQVEILLMKVIKELASRIVNHDKSKLESPEREILV